jgi:peroxiredoxin
MQTEQRTAYLGSGDRMPDLTLARLGGGELAFSALRGQHVLLYLWASW